MIAPGRYPRPGSPRQVCAALLAAAIGCAPAGSSDGAGAAGTRYSCNGKICVVDPAGTFSTADCDRSCGGSAGSAAYSCSGTACVADPQGIFSSSTCENMCALSGCSLSGATMTVSVTILDTSVSPSCVAVAIGDTVTWTNRGTQAREIASLPGSTEGFSSGTLLPGDSWGYAFTAAGMDPYGALSRRPAAFTGTVIVQ